MKMLFTVLLSLLPAALLAHPGHGLGELGHDTQHALWNFAGVVVVAAVVLLWLKAGGKRK